MYRWLPTAGCITVCSPDKAGEERGEVTDKKGWDAYRNDWRNFFECMLAPVAQQVEGGRLNTPHAQKAFAFGNTIASVST